MNWNKALGHRSGPSLSKEREELLLGLYNEGLNDTKIAEKVDRDKSSIRSWRLRKRLPANAPPGRQSVQKSAHKVEMKTGETRKERTKKEPEKKPKKKETVKERKLSVRRLAEGRERAIVESLPGKDEVYQKVRNSPDGQITTKQLIRQKYGDVGYSRMGEYGRGDTVHKLRLLEREGLIELDTDSQKGQIIWRA